MNQNNPLSFLPEDYLERKKEIRSTLICGALFLLAMGLMGAAFWFSEESTRKLETSAKDIDTQFIRDAERIKQVGQMQERQSRMAWQAEVTSSLLEKVPRSLILAEYTNLLPTGASLLDITLDSKVVTTASAAVPGNKTALDSKKDAKAAAEATARALMAPRQYDVTMKVVGMAQNDGQVAQYLKKLSQSPLFKDVNLTYTEEHLFEKQPMRKFEVEMGLNPNGAEIKKNEKTKPAESIERSTASTTGGEL